MTGEIKVGIKIQADADAAKDALRDTADALADIDRKADPAKYSIDDLGQGIERAGAKARTAGGAIGSMVDELAPIGTLALGINEVAELLGRIGGQAAELMSGRCLQANSRPPGACHRQRRGRRRGAGISARNRRRDRRGPKVRGLALWPAGNGI